jgi:hypothetical protein
MDYGARRAWQDAAALLLLLLLLLLLRLAAQDLFCLLLMTLPIATILLVLLLRLLLLLPETRTMLELFWLLVAWTANRVYDVLLLLVTGDVPYRLLSIEALTGIE